jgi:dTDP-4-dehydrorhamnose reductase
VRILVTGTKGQLARALQERALDRGIEIFAVGRPELDLADERFVIAALRRAAPDAVINAAAYTAVDLAENEEDAAAAVNARGAGAVAMATAALGVPLVHVSTDYVFAGAGDMPYDEDAPTGPLGAYGRTKLAGEIAVRQATNNYAIIRTAWVFSPFGKNFVKTMMARARAAQDVRVVADQHGSPTYAPDLADALLDICQNLVAKPEETVLRGVFHAANTGFASWADVATETFDASKRYGGPVVNVTGIMTAEYPTPARRPANSRLSTDKLRRVHGVTLPDWRDALDRCVSRLLTDEGDAL